MIVLGKSLRTVIETNYPQVFPFEYLYLKDTESFISYVNFHAFPTKKLESNDGHDTYLQYACKFGFTKVVKMLLDFGVDPNGITSANNTYPLFIAASKGFADVIQVFVEIRNSDIIYQMYEYNTKFDMVKTSALHLVIENSHNEPENKSCELRDYDRSFYLLLPIHSKIDVNYFDYNGNTCLHEAALVPNQNYITSLLDNGAYIAMRNSKGECLLDYINHGALELYLNKCIKTDEEIKKGLCPNIVISYGFLCPPRIHYDKTNCHYQHVINEDLDFPNVFLKSITETYPLMCISKDSHLKRLLAHPVLSSLIHLKWLKIKKYYYIKLIFYLLFLVSQTTYILLVFRPISNDASESIRYLWFITLLFIIVFTVHELFQLILFPKAFFFSLENWQEISIIILTFCLLFEYVSIGFTKIKLSIAVFVILISWNELICILGRHPMFAIPLAMLTVVAKNFFKFLLLYSILMIAFILSLFVLFNNAKHNDSHYSQTYNQNNKDYIFSDLWLTFFKTIVMLTGELDASNLPFSPENEKIGQIVIVLFIVFIPIILVNLLNGLAVSDIKQINDDAEIIVLMSRLIFINSFEKVSLKIFTYNKMGNNSFLTRFFCLKLKLFPSVLKNKKLNIFYELRNYFIQIQFDKVNNNNDEIIDKALSIIKLNSEVLQKSNNGNGDSLNEAVKKIDFLVSSVEKINHRLNEINITITK